MSSPRPRGPRTSAPAPNNVTFATVIAVVALLLGFFVLRNVSASSPSTGGNNGGNGNGNGNSEESTTTTLDPTASSIPALVLTSFKIQVANASGVAGSAGKLTTDLQAMGYVVQTALNSAPGTPKRAKTGVFYGPGCNNAAQNVATTLSGTIGSTPEIGALPSPVPLETGTMREACVLIMLGTDLAGKTLTGSPAGNSQMAPTTTTTIAPAG